MILIIIDNALRKREEEGNLLRVGLIGTGFMGRGIINQIVNSVPGMVLAAAYNRTAEKASKAFVEAGVPDSVTVSNGDELEDAFRSGRPAVTDDPYLLTRAQGIDVLIEATGAVEFGAHVTLDAIANGKHMVSMNAELDGTVGPIIQEYAREKGVIFSASDGDQPGVQMNLVRFVRSIGLTPVLAGNVKGLQDPYRNPTTQKGFAEKWGQNVNMVTSFADGTKISFEQAIVANGTGMSVAKRGMHGHDWTGHVDEATQLYDVHELRELRGTGDYLGGAKPAQGVFVYATHDDPKQQHYLNLYKLGEGPLYSFYTPYHLCHFEVPLSAARVALFGDAMLQPLGAPKVEVVATAKRDLRSEEHTSELQSRGHLVC